jgi:restriction system protein
MQTTETLDQRRDRLKEQHEERVARIAANLPVNSAGADLLSNGFYECLIRDHVVSIEKIECSNLPTADITEFRILVDDFELDERLQHISSRGSASFYLKIPKWLASISSKDHVLNESPLKVLWQVIDDEAFPRYVEMLAAERLKIQATAKEWLTRARSEAELFRDVLVRKYHQLTYIDEYKTRDVSRFKDELKRFAEKRLQNIPAPAVIEVLFNLVSDWASEEISVTDQHAFNPAMSPLDYERFCAERFAALGWTARLTKTSGDQGADIICEANQKRLVVQCKLYSGSIGNDAVQEVIAAREYEYADLAAVVSNAPFTKAAQQLASTAAVLLLHHDEIASVGP